MNLETHLSIRTPVIWVTTDEAFRVIDVVIKDPARPVFRIEPFLGFCRWSSDRNEWVRVIVGDGPGAEPTRDLNEAIPIVAAEGGTLILEHAHKQPLEMLVTAFAERFRDSVIQDNVAGIPPQLVLCSCKDEVPPEIERVVARIDQPLPTAEELTTLTGKLSTGAGLDLDPEVTVRSGRAVTGLSESETIVTVLGSLAENSGLDPVYLARNKLDTMKGGGILEVRTPRYTIDDVGGLDRAKLLFEAIRWTWEHPDQTREYGITAPRRLLFVGLQGSGKSLIAEAAAQGLGLDLAKGGVSSAMTKWVGESERKMRLMFKQLRAMAPIVFWVDELGRDLSGGASSAEVDGGTTDRVHGEFLSGLQELEDNVFLLAAANRIDHLPPEMTRADRFDRIMFVGFPSEDERREIIAIHLGEQALHINLAAVAGATQFFTGAEIKALVRTVRFDVAARERRAAKTEDFVAAAPYVKSRAWTRHKGEIVAMYERARDEWEWASTQQEDEAHNIIKAAKTPAFTPKVHTPAADFSPANFDS